MMGYQPKVQPELKYPPGNPNVYCGECSAKIDDGMDKCPECGTSFPSRLPISLYTGEPYDPAWGTVLQKGGGRGLLKPKKQPLRKCLQCRQMKHEDFHDRCHACHLQNERELAYQIEAGEPLPLDRNLIGWVDATSQPEPHDYLWYFLKWLASSVLNRWRIVCFSLRPGPYIEDMARRLEVATAGKRDSHVPLLLSGEQGTELFSAKMLTAGKVTMIEAINNMRAIHGYEPLPEEPQADHQEMQFAPADWRAE